MVGLEATPIVDRLVQIYRKRIWLGLLKVSIDVKVRRIKRTEKATPARVWGLLWKCQFLKVATADVAVAVR